MMRVIMPSDLDLAVEAIEAGELVAAPTRRWYMVCADATNSAACSRVFTGKQRPTTKSLAFVVPSIYAARDLFVMSSEARQLAAALWPGDLALVLPWREPSQGERHAAVGTPHALVISDPGVLGELANRSRAPIAATTLSISGANTAGPGPAITTAEVHRFTQTTGLDVAYCIEGGISPLAHHLTIVDCTAPRAKLVRSGVVHERAVEAALHLDREASGLAAGTSGAAAPAAGR